MRIGASAKIHAHVFALAPILTRPKIGKFCIDGNAYYAGYVNTSYQNCLEFVILCSDRWLKIRPHGRKAHFAFVSVTFPRCLACVGVLGLECDERLFVALGQTAVVHEDLPAAQHWLWQQLSGREPHLGVHLIHDFHVDPFLFWEEIEIRKMAWGLFYFLRRNWNKKTWNARDFIFWEGSESRIFLTLSLPRSIKFKFTLQSHQKYYITEVEELSFSQLTQMKDDKIPILTTLLIHFSLNGWKNVLGS